MKNCLLSLLQDLLPNISCCKSATRVGQGLELGLELGLGLEIIFYLSISGPFTIGEAAVLFRK